MFFLFQVSPQRQTHANESSDWQKNERKSNGKVVASKYVNV